jgi:hypothetical protein
LEAFVEGTIYDTSRATVVGSRDNGRIDSRRYSETLYRRNRDGAFFLHANGAPFSRYSEIRHRVCLGREAILPLSDAEAEKWVRSLPDRPACAF